MNNEWEERLTNDLDNTVWGLKDSSNTNRARNRIIGLVFDEKKESEREGAIKALEELANVDSVSFDDWMNNHYGLLNKLKNEQ